MNILGFHAFFGETRSGEPVRSDGEVNAAKTSAVEFAGESQGEGEGSAFAALLEGAVQKSVDQAEPLELGLIPFGRGDGSGPPESQGERAADAAPPTPSRGGATDDVDAPAGATQLKAPSLSAQSLGVILGTHRSVAAGSPTGEPRLGLLTDGERGRILGSGQNSRTGAAVLQMPAEPEVRTPTPAAGPSLKQGGEVRQGEPAQGRPIDSPEPEIESPGRALPEPDLVLSAAPKSEVAGVTARDSPTRVPRSIVRGGPALSPRAPGVSPFGRPTAESRGAPEYLARGSVPHGEWDPVELEATGESRAPELIRRPETRDRPEQREHRSEGTGPRPDRPRPLSANLLPGAGLKSDTIEVRFRGRTGADPDRDLRRLDPRLRAVVGRVMHRLEREFGIEAQVSEGFRSAARQQTLFAQGRTSPGKVVTWTLDSAHMKGRAVDLVLNGQWSDLDPYRVLQQVAKEEGLATLGMKDPGHLALPRRSNAGSRGNVRAYPDAPQGPTPSGISRSRLASPAQVAGVAGRAQVAKAAAPAVPGRGTRRITKEVVVAPKDTGGAGENTQKALIPETPLPIPEPQLNTPGLERSAPSSEVSEVAAPRRPEDGGGSPSRISPESPQVEAEASPINSPASPTAIHRGSVTKPTTESGTAGRVEQVRALQEAAESRPSGMRVDLGDVDGSGTRVRLDLRGGKVAARIDVKDPVLGSDMKREMGSLKAALQSKGLEPDEIHVRTVTRESVGSSGRPTLSESAVRADGESREPRERNRDGSGAAKDERREHPRREGPRQENQNQEERHD